MEPNFNRKRRIVFRVIFGICFALIGAYIFMNLRLPWSSPAIIIHDTYLDGIENGTITVSGEVKRANSLTLNGSNILMSRDGEFSDTINIPNGYTVLEINALDKFGHSTIKTIQVYR